MSPGQISPCHWLLPAVKNDPRKLSSKFWQKATEIFDNNSLEDGGVYLNQAQLKLCTLGFWQLKGVDKKLTFELLCCSYLSLYIGSLKFLKGKGISWNFTKKVTYVDIQNILLATDTFRTKHTLSNWLRMGRGQFGYEI